MDKAQRVNKRNIQSRQIWETANLHLQNWTESCEEVQNNIIKSNPNLIKQKLENPNSSKY